MRQWREARIQIRVWGLERTGSVRCGTQQRSAVQRRPGGPKLPHRVHSELRQRCHIMSHHVAKHRDWRTAIARNCPRFTSLAEPHSAPSMAIEMNRTQLIRSSKRAGQWRERHSQYSLRESTLNEPDESVVIPDNSNNFKGGKVKTDFNVDIQYSYTPSTVPEAPTIAFLALSLGLLAFQRRRTASTTNHLLSARTPGLAA